MISSTTNLDASWFARPRPRSEAKLRLFCIAYAGGGPHVFNSWLALLPPAVEMVAICLPGRGRRFTEPACNDVGAVMQALVPLFPLDKPFALFGHSMGALLGFELARRLREAYGIEPEHLFVSACFAPQEPDPHPIHQLDEADFVGELRALNGMPREVLASDELMELVLPILRADFTLTETYHYTESHPFRCPITALGGRDDTFATPAILQPWDRHTGGRFELQTFPGGHFYLQAAERELLAFLSAKLAVLVTGLSNPAPQRAALLRHPA